MTLRYDTHGSPVGLDWAMISAGCEQDRSVWAAASLVVQTKPRGTRLPDATEVEIIRLHLAGTTARQIAELVEVSMPTVAAVLDRRGVTEDRGRGTRQRTPADVTEEIIRLYTEEKLSGAAVGARVGVQHATVYKILRRNGIMPRTQGAKERTSVAS